MHFLLRNEIPRQLVTRSCRQFSQELSLCPPVALAKWMDGVHLSKEVSSSLAEPL